MRNRPDRFRHNLVRVGFLALVAFIQNEDARLILGLARWGRKTDFRAARSPVGPGERTIDIISMLVQHKSVRIVMRYQRAKVAATLVAGSSNSHLVQHGLD
jgi:hypothetical protein